MKKMTIKGGKAILGIALVAIIITSVLVVLCGSTGAMGAITITAEKTSCVELETIRVTVTGVTGDDIHVASSPLSPNVIFRPGVDDTPVDATNQFNHTIDADGVRTYAVKFNETETFTIQVTVTSGPRDGEYDTVNITVSDKAVVFDVPSTVVIGEKLEIKGVANTGTHVDVFVDEVLYSPLNNLMIAPNGEFSEEVTTTDVGIDRPLIGKAKGVDRLLYKSRR